MPTNTNNQIKMSVENNTFNYELPKDIFQREQIAQQMCKIIANMNQEEISPLVLNGAWGSGKSVHARRLEIEFNKHYDNNIKCLYWNASESDFSDNPLLAFIIFLYQHVADEKKTEFKKSGLKIGWHALLGGISNLANQALKVGTGIDVNEICHASVECSEIYNNSDMSMEARFSALLEEYGNVASRFTAAQELLQIVSPDKKLIIIVDELDRCCPTFALKMLESIKHLFSMKNCIFILVMNKRALAHSVERMYGIKGTDAEKYLDKYIKVQFQLSSTNLSVYGDTNYCAHRYFVYLTSIKLAAKANSGQQVNYWDSPLVSSFINHLISEKEFSLRDMEKLVTTIRFVTKASQDDLTQFGDINALFIAYIAYLMAFNQDLARQLASKEAKLDQIFSDIGWNKTLSLQEQPSYISILRPIIEVCVSHGDKKKDLIEQYTNEDPWNRFYVRLNFFERWLEYSAFIQ